MMRYIAVGISELILSNYALVLEGKLNRTTTSLHYTNVTFRVIKTVLE